MSECPINPRFPDACRRRDFCDGAQMSEWHRASNLFIAACLAALSILYPALDTHRQAYRGFGGMAQ